MVAPVVNLVLDDITFANNEIPQTINFGGKQALVVHDLIGGTRVVDSMGAFTEPIAWSGMFLGANAADRARALDSKRKAGKQVVLSWHEQRYTVVIREFKANFERAYQIMYNITVEVIADQSSTVAKATQSVDTLIAQDMTTANNCMINLQALPAITAGSASTSTLAGLMSTLQSAISNVSSFATATQSQLNSVLQPIAAVRSQIKLLAASVDNTLKSVSTLGGILPGNSLSQQVAKMSTQLAAVESHPLLITLDRVVSRVSLNAQTSYTTSKQVTQSGGNLYTLASQQYGDATSWTAIAKANNLTDPVISGTKTLTIPPAKDVTDGILDF